MPINLEQPINVILTQIDERLTLVEAAITEENSPEPVVAPLIGVNLVGGQYDFSTNFYPFSSQVQYWVEKGVTILRIPMLIERLIPDPATGFDAFQIGEIDRIITVAREYQNPAYPVMILIDNHNYDNGDVPGDAERWALIAERYAADPYVGYELMNEPPSQDYTYTTPFWIGMAQAIFAKDVLGPVVFPLAGGDIDYSFYEYESWKVLSDAIKANFPDRIDQCKLTFHQYTPAGDARLDGSTSHESQTIMVRKAASVMAAIDREGLGWLYGEVAIPAGTAEEYAQPGFDETTGDTVSMWDMDNFLSAMMAQQHKHAWGITFWGAGRVGSYHPVRNPNAERWGLDPINGVDQPQVRIMQRYLPGGEKFGQITQAFDGPGATSVPPNFTGNDPVWGKGVQDANIDGFTLQKSRSIEYTYVFAVSGIASAVAQMRSGEINKRFLFNGNFFAAALDVNTPNFVFGYWKDGLQREYVSAGPLNDFTDDVHILTLTVDATSGRVYKDGVLMSTGAAGTPKGLAPDGIVIGGGNGFAGVIHEVQIYHRSFTTTEVQAIAPATGRETGLVCYYPFEADVASRVGLRGGLPSRYMQVLGITG